MIKVAINGFGRIGRPVLKIIQEKEDMEVVAINDLSSLENLVYLLKYDTAYGIYKNEVSWEEGKIKIGDKEIKVLAEPDPEKLPWKEMGIDVVLECTGFFTNREGAEKHLKAGAKKVVISAPTKDESIKTFVLGVNADEIKEEDDIISNASCTTNSLAPMMKVLDDNFGVEKSLMSTIHSYTSTQSLVDGISKKDMRRGRAAAQNIIPSTTGAAIATVKTLPQLENRFDGMAFRVPTLVGSVSDLTVLLKQETTKEDIFQAFIDASNNELKNILEVTEEPLVSHDIVGNPHSVIVQADLIKVTDKNLVKVIGWYDNEWGYSNRLVEMAHYLIKKFQK